MTKPESPLTPEDIEAHLRDGRPLAEMVISPPIVVEAAADGGFLVYGLASAGAGSLGLPMLFRFPSEAAKILLASLRTPGNGPGAPRREDGPPSAH